MDRQNDLRDSRRVNARVKLSIETDFVRKLERPRGLNTVNDYIEAIETKRKDQRRKMLHLAREPKFDPGCGDERAVALGEICTGKSSENVSVSPLLNNYAAGAADTSIEPPSTKRHLNLASSQYVKPGSKLAIRMHEKSEGLVNKEKSKQSSRRSDGESKSHKALLSRRLQDGCKTRKVKKLHSSADKKKKSNQLLGKVDGLTFWPKNLEQKLSTQRNTGQRKAHSLSGSSCKLQMRIKREQLSQPMSIKKKNSYQRAASGRELSIDRSNSKMALKSLSSIFRKRKGAALLQQPSTSRRDSRPGSSIHLGAGLLRRASKDPDAYFLRKPLVHQPSGSSTKRLRCTRELEQLYPGEKKTILHIQSGRHHELSKHSLPGEAYVSNKDAILARLCCGHSYNIQHSYSQNASSLIAKSNKVNKVPNIPAFSSRAPLVHPMKIQLGKYAEKNARLNRQDINETIQMRPRRFKGERVGSFLALNLAQCPQVWHPTRSKPDCIQTHH